MTVKRMGGRRTLALFVTLFLLAFSAAGSVGFAAGTKTVVTKAGASETAVSQTAESASAAAETTAQVQQSQAKGKHTSFWKILIAAVCIGILAAVYGVSDMLIRKKKMNDMLTKVRLRKGPLADMPEDEDRVGEKTRGADEADKKE